MKIEVRCSACTCAWLIDEPPRGAELLCPACMAKIELNPPPAPEPTPPPRQEADPVLSSRWTTAPAKPQPEPVDEDVVCPRCKLHFNPRGRAPEEPQEPKRTVLIVEDLDYFREIAAESLSSTYEVKTATCSGEAREALAEGGIDLLVLDLTLDGGEEGRQFLCELDPKPCPILIFTAQDESELYGESWDELSRLGADDVVFKGMQVEESLVRKVGELLGTPLDEQEPIR